MPGCQFQPKPLPIHYKAEGKDQCSTHSTSMLVLALKNHENEKGGNFSKTEDRTANHKLIRFATNNQIDFLQDESNNQW